MADNTSIDYWWIDCDCQRLKDCPKCNNTGKIYPDRCPVHYYDNELKTLRIIYDSYTHKNILPFSGSLIEQPKKLMNIIGVIDQSLYNRSKISSIDKEETDDMVARINQGKY